MTSTLPKKPEISLVFVNYRSAAYLEDALKSLFLHEKGSFFEVVIVNNDGEESEALEKLKQLRQDIVIIESGENVGFGRAVNVAVQLAQGEYIGLLNPDTIWTKRQLNEILVEIRKENAIIGLSLLDSVGRRERYNFGSKVSFWRLLLNHLPKKQDLVHGKRLVDWVSGGALFLSRSLFQELGGFDEKYFLYYEDVDLCERARRRGIQSYVYGDFSLVHYRGKSQESIGKQKAAYYQSQMYYFQKMRPVYEQWLLRISRVFL